MRGKQKKREKSAPHFQKMRKNLLNIVRWTRPGFYSEIDNVTYVIAKPFKYVNWKFSYHMHMFLKWLYEEIFVENVTEVAARWIIRKLF